jgi:hypothetical protein
MASSNQITVTSTGILIIESYGEFRDVHLRNVGSHSMFVGGEGVTTSTGFNIPKDAYINFKVGPKSTVYAITNNNETGVASMLFMEP